MPESTQMFAEAAEAADVIARQFRLNAGAIEQLARRLRNDPPDTVLTVARGSSDHAATFARYLIETRLGVVTASLSPSVVSVYGASPRAADPLCLAISQSGRSPDLIAAVEALQAGGAHVVGLVNKADSPLAALSEDLLPLHAGPEVSVAATKSFIAALGGLAMLVAKWDEDAALEAALQALPDLLAKSWQCDWSPLVDGLIDCAGLYVIGRGHGLGVAEEAALKFKETCGIQAEAFSAAEVRHGPMALVGKDFPLLIFRQSDESAEGIDALVGEVVARGGAVFVAGPAIPGAVALPYLAADSVIEPILQIQSFYRAANALSVARGFNPDAPPHLAKETKTL